MPPKSKIGSAMEPVKLQWRLAISGGRLRTPQLVDTVERTFEDVAHHFTPVHHLTPWLVEMASGEYVSRRPLKRCTIFQKLQDLVQTPSNEGKPADPMQGLSYDDPAEVDIVETPPKKKKSKNTKEPDCLVRVTLPTLPSANVESFLNDVPAEVAVVGIVDGRLVIEVAALSWLVQYLADEVISGSVSPVKEKPPAEDDELGSRIYWDFPNNRWVGRAKTMDGKWSQTFRSVKKRQKSMEHLDFQQVKQVVYDELTAWTQEAGQTHYADL